MPVLSIDDHKDTSHQVQNVSRILKSLCGSQVVDNTTMTVRELFVVCFCPKYRLIRVHVKH